MLLRSSIDHASFNVARQSGGPEEFLSVRLNLFREPDRPFAASEDRLQQQPALPLRQAGASRGDRYKGNRSHKRRRNLFHRATAAAKAGAAACRNRIFPSHRARRPRRRGWPSSRRAIARRRRSQEIGSSNRSRRNHPHPPELDMDGQPIAVPLHLIHAARAPRRHVDEHRKARLYPRGHRAWWLRRWLV